MLLCRYLIGWGRTRLSTDEVQGSTVKLTGRSPSPLAAPPPHDRAVPSFQRHIIRPTTPPC